MRFSVNTHIGFTTCQRQWMQGEEKTSEQSITAG